MFMGCANIEEINFSNFDTSSVTNMDGMFFMTNLKSLDLSSFRTSNVQSMEGFLPVNPMNTANPSALEYLDISSFDFIYNDIGDFFFL